MMKLVDDIVSQIYFTSGAIENGPEVEGSVSSPHQLLRFWNDSKELLKHAADEQFAHTVFQLVQTLNHLLPCAPREVFLIAANAICNGAKNGFQYESLAVSEVVKIIQRSLADHREIFRTSSVEGNECLAELLRMLDLFVEAGWPQARELTYRLEEINC